MFVLFWLTFVCFCLLSIESNGGLVTAGTLIGCCELLRGGHGIHGRSCYCPNEQFKIQAVFNFCKKVTSVIYLPPTTNRRKSSSSILASNLDYTMKPTWQHHNTPQYHEKILPEEILLSFPAVNKIKNSKALKCTIVNLLPIA